ncbi:MurR/RpiR family transcriptional regulator [Petropleomorpha daqingensis]|uniref:DNA-binding MurR/RpiR family transcriptional regulator n=1 Tax=Petropleomorpha daqingensis TaxID=2026353 RepID=A0A853CFY7_9ACTN|nr:MurR/RpiR family transcriptional regulator [Petropleomorpha daqingensis]NYJ06875.1 DNA-binding MurR/RpiR family transcriptional regulator [Petropleomorpha daqingensis]
MSRIRDAIFDRMEELSPAEKKVARSLLADYPSAGLASAAALAKAAGTSTPTVLRLVTRLGMGGYPEFQELLRREVTEHMTSPVSRAAGRLASDGGDTLFQRSVALRVALVERLAESVPPSEFDAAVALLAAPCRNVVVSGGYFSRHMAQILALQLDQLVPDVRYAAEPLGRDIGSYLELGKDSAVVIFDLRRYELPAKGVAAMAKQRGASVVVITDEGLSPAADEADVVLPVAVDGTPFDSFAGLLVLVESLVEGVFQRRGEAALGRMRQWEESVQIHRAFRAATGAVHDRAEAGDDES